MRILRTFVASLVAVGLSTQALAGDLQTSIAKAAQQQGAQPQQTSIDGKYLWPGTALFVAGMTMAVWGFLHTKGGPFVSGEVSKESDTKLGGAGLALAGAGGALLFLGSQRAKKSAAITVGRGQVAVAKRVSW